MSDHDGYYERDDYDYYERDNYDDYDYYERDDDDYDYYDDYEPPSLATRIVNRVRWFVRGHFTRCSQCKRLNKDCDCIPF